MDVETGQKLYAQQFGGRWTFLEYAETEFQMSRKSRLYMLHETIIDRAMESINNEDLRGRLYDGLDIDIKNDTGKLIETYYLEALAEHHKIIPDVCKTIWARPNRCIVGEDQHTIDCAYAWSQAWKRFDSEQGGF